MTQPIANSTANPLPAFKAVLWDMDGTLVLSDPVHAICLQRIGDEMGMPTSEELAWSALGISHRFAYDTLTKALGELKLSFDDWVKREAELYVELVAQIQPRGHVIDVLRGLHQRGIKQAIFSNNPRNFIDATTKGLLRFFDGAEIFNPVISLDDVSAKPSPDGYLLAAKTLGVKPEECLVIEDSPTGVAAGKAAGCFTIYWPSDLHKTLSAQPDLIVNDLSVLL